MSIFVKRAVAFLLVCCATQFVLSQKITVNSPETQKHIKDVVAGLTPGIVVKGDANAQHSLSDRMASWHVPG